MAESSGFFPSVSDDRSYTAAWLAKWVASFLSNGTYDGELAVMAVANMQVKLPAGRAWINGYYYRNDGDMTLPIANADGVLNRKDTIVLRWDVNERSITVQVLQGTLASAATAPAIVRTVEQYDLKLAEISIPAGTTAITQSLITDTRLNTDVCGIVHAVVDHLDTATFYAQVQNDLANFKSGSETDFNTWKSQFQSDLTSWKSTSESNFNTWLSGIQGILNEDEAGNLLNLINGKADKTHASTHATGGSDAIAPADIGAQAAITASGILKGTGSAVSAATRGTDYSLINSPVTVTFGTSGWALNSTTGAYEQSVACTGLLTTDDQRTRVEPVGNASDPDAQAMTDEAYACVDYFACTTNGQLYARSPDAAPTVAFQVRVIIER
ncbi:MAG: hypothetical protein VB112_03200 [Oscillospiraceae bacterium]|nr:hypothetical protein [Oscillospiraceae bacterium]